jgi:hypothetical protein
MARSLLKKRKIRDRNLFLFASVLGATAAACYYRDNFVKNTQHNSKLTGIQWMYELLNHHPRRCRDNLGISQEGFKYLEDLLRRKGGLCGTRYMGTTEQLGIYLYAVVTDLSMRKLAERFQRSTETINRVYHKVMRCFLAKELYESIIVAPTLSTPLADKIQYNFKYFPWFKDCVGAIDGTHIPVSPPEGEKAMFRDRKGNLSQNVLATCNLDMQFTDIMTGWEGSVSDSTLWVEGQRRGAVRIPEGKYVLGDAGFPNCDQCLTPYRATRYHLKEWERGNQKPQNKEELFNLRHATLRNAIERIFGIVKNRFKILTRPRAFKMVSQVRVVSALCVLHNILVDIREVEELDEDIEEALGALGNISLEDGDELAENQRSGEGYHISRREVTRAMKARDDIAIAMWEDYIARVAIRDRRL